MPWDGYSSLRQYQSQHMKIQLTVSSSYFLPPPTLKRQRANISRTNTPKYDQVGDHTQLLCITRGSILLTHLPLHFKAIRDHPPSRIGVRVSRSAISRQSRTPAGMDTYMYSTYVQEKLKRQGGFLCSQCTPVPSADHAIFWPVPLVLSRSGSQRLPLQSGIPSGRPKMRRVWRVRDRCA